MNVFISHSSRQAPLAARIEAVLEARGVKVWLDQSEIRPGRLLRTELQEALKNGRAVVLLWSKSAAKSRWVAAEVLTAFHMGRFIIGCACDRTPLPFFLQRTIYLTIQSRKMDWVQPLHRAILEAPRTANPVLPKMGSQSPALRRKIDELAKGELAVTDSLGNDNLTRAKKLQALMDRRMKMAERQWPLEVEILNLAGYHRKNAFMLKHWAAIQAGQPPRDGLLERAERYFFEALFVDPYDIGALNGLGSILILERELNAAEFFIRRALRLAKNMGMSYPAAQQDLDLVLRYKRTNPTRLSMANS